MVDVLVDGGGPVGLLAASEQGVRGCAGRAVRTKDINEAPVIMTKASGIMERSTEILLQQVVYSIMKTSKQVTQARKPRAWRKRQRQSDRTADNRVAQTRG
eukprot:TRINITY_DN36010_c0_g1_i1.p1 TRINITY_DN36010_c0_g1~~TRINITY_DN36010_c0_g1_i1.p1  ORF type:complete len:101 (-),score=12.93 TRINITY_DN36010_c0_g1_i1:170-472(-)